MAEISGNLGVTFGSGTAANGFDQDTEENTALKRDYYAKQTALIKENLAMNLALDNLKMAVSVANKGSTIAKDAITG